MSAEILKPVVAGTLVMLLRTFGISLPSKRAAGIEMGAVLHCDLRPEGQN